MTMCKLSVYLLLIINLIYIVDGYYQFQKYGNGQSQREVGCTNDIKKMVHKVRKEVNCMPRTTLMKLVLDNEYTYYPNVIPLQRCHGNCRHLSCFPVANRTVPIYLERSHLSSNTVTCVAVNVEEHTKCKCLCEVMKEHCNEKQKHSNRDCQCVCKNDLERRKCLEQSNMTWDSKNCKCMCDKMEEPCASGLMWLRDKCACAKVIVIEDDLKTNNIVDYKQDLL